MKRGLTVAVAGAAVLIAGLSGCSGDKKSSSPSSSAGGGGGGSSATKVLIDGQDQNVAGSTVCNTTAGTVAIVIGAQGTGVTATLTDANPPEVKAVALGTVNGVALGYAQGDGQGKAEATKNGNSYKITGTASGADMANPTAFVKKSFEINVTCP